ncbi:MAG TPA: sugar phosphate isomerase/epimerase [Chloroflexota bacterium]|nr:sugar phosphate isomerase/epimerase [Chloroflexota bacterium]
MRIGMFTDSLIGSSLDEALDTSRDLGLRDLEIGTGNYSPAPHCDLRAVLGDKAARDRWLDGFTRRGLSICALNCSGNPLHPDQEHARQHDAVIRDTLRLAGELGVSRVVTMSGCPGAPGDSSVPHWSIGAFLPDYEDVFTWQWEERILPYWHDLAAFAAAQGVERVCLELHPGMTVYNTYTLLRLRSEVGPVVFANLDPSHLFWQGMDPLAVIAALGDAIGYVHAKDTLIDLNNAALNGFMDSRWLGKPGEMPWYFCTMGYGHDAGFWKAFAVKLRAHGYDGVLSIEHEDPLMTPLDGVRKSVRFLEEVIPAE